MKFAFFLPAVVCFLMTLQTANAATVLLNGEICSKVLLKEEHGNFVCEPGTYCMKFMQPPGYVDPNPPQPICSPVCPTCYVSEAVLNEHVWMPATEMRCMYGYASRVDYAWYSGLPAADYACNVCDKGFYSQDASQNGKGSYNSSTTPYPGNVGCMKCDAGYTTLAAGSGITVADCSFFGRLPQNWATIFFSSPDPVCDNLSAAAVARVTEDQTNLLTASISKENTEMSLRGAQEDLDMFMRMSNDAVQSAVAQQQQMVSMMQEFNRTVSMMQEFNRTAKSTLGLISAFNVEEGTLTCFKNSDCDSIADIVIPVPPGGNPDLHPTLNCIKKYKGERGVCKHVPGVDDVPVCVETCAIACFEAEAAKLAMPLAVYMANFNGDPNPEMCSCLAACDLSSCTTDIDKARISHTLRDRCDMDDPYYAPPPPPPTDGSGTPPPPTDGSGTPPPPTDGSGTPPPPTDGSGTPPPRGGTNLKCGLGQFVLNKNVNGMEVCTDCPPGRFAKAKTTRNKECKKCPRGFVQPEVKQGRCNRCPIGSYSNPERTLCAPQA